MKCLHLIPAQGGSLGDNRMIMLHAVREDGISVRLGQFAWRNLAQWLELLPQLAQNSAGCRSIAWRNPAKKNDGQWFRLRGRRRQRR